MTPGTIYKYTNSILAGILTSLLSTAFGVWFLVTFVYDFFDDRLLYMFKWDASLVVPLIQLGALANFIPFYLSMHFEFYKAGRGIIMGALIIVVLAFVLNII